MISQQSLSSIQNSIDEAILESQTTSVPTEELIETNEIVAAQESPAAEITISIPSEDPIPCSNFPDEPVIPSQREECNDPYRHRAILDLGAELFDHLDDLKGVDGEYILHILEATQARLQLLSSSHTSIYDLWFFRIRFTERWIDRHVECEIFSPTIPSLLQAIDLVSDLATSVRASIANQDLNSSQIDPHENSSDPVAASFNHYPNSSHEEKLSPYQSSPPPLIPLNPPIHNSSNFNFRPPPPPPPSIHIPLPPYPPPSHLSFFQPSPPPSQSFFSGYPLASPHHYNNHLSKLPESQPCQQSALPRDQKTEYVKRNLDCCEDIQMSDETSQRSHPANGRKRGSRV